MACQQDLAEAALADHLEEVEVAGLGRGVGGRTEVDLLGWTRLWEKRESYYEPESVW